MGKSRSARRQAGGIVVARVNVLRPNASKTAWVSAGRVFLVEALRKIARHEWQPVWYEDGELAGVHPFPPKARGDVAPMRCGSVECLRWWILGATSRIVGLPSRATPSRVLIDFFDVDAAKTLRRVSAELAIRKIDLGHWKAIWCENGELAGVAAV